MASNHAPPTPCPEIAAAPSPGNGTHSAAPVIAAPAIGARRTTLAATRRILQANPEWKVLDVGCGAAPWPEATTLLDLADIPRPPLDERPFIRAPIERTAFAPYAFDFVVAARVLESVGDPIAVCRELARIAPRGYIEVISPLFHNLVRGFADEHRHWVHFDDETGALVFRPAKRALPDFFTGAHFEALRTVFPESTVTRLFWQGEVHTRLESVLS
jgi:hypothetical protein